MEDSSIDRILENMLVISTVMHKKLLRLKFDGFANGLTRIDLAIMGELSQTNMTMSELAKALMMTKPQCSHVVDPLVRLGIVERHPVTNDRRLINLELTEKGHKSLKEMKLKVKESIKNRLASLTTEELFKMSSALETLRNVADKLML